MGEWESVAKLEKSNSCNNMKESTTLHKNFYVVEYLNNKVTYLAVGA